jgi:hypothetical protein
VASKIESIQVTGATSRFPLEDPPVPRSAICSLGIYLVESAHVIEGDRLIRSGRVSPPGRSGRRRAGEDLAWGAGVSLRGATRPQRQLAPRRSCRTVRAGSPQQAVAGSHHCDDNGPVSPSAFCPEACAARYLADPFSRPLRSRYRSGAKLGSSSWQCCGTPSQCLSRPRRPIVHERREVQRRRLIGTFRTGP